MKKAISIIAIVIVLITVLALPASAATPYYTYTYSINGKDMRSPDAYVPDKEITADYIGLKNEALIKKFYPNLTDSELNAKMELNNPTDLEVDENNNVYIVDNKNNRVIVLDPYYKLKFIIDTFKNASGNTDVLKEPEGVFITSDKNVNGVMKRVESSFAIQETQEFLPLTSTVIFLPK